MKPSKKQPLQRLSDIGLKYRDKGEDAVVILERMRDAEESERMAELSAVPQGSRDQQ